MKRSLSCLLAATVMACMSMSAMALAVEKPMEATQTMRTPAVGDAVLFHPAAWDQALAVDQVHEVQVSAVLADGFVDLTFTHSKLNRETLTMEEVEEARASVYLHQPGAPKPLSYWCEFPTG